MGGFEWDEAKNAENRRKHGISFQEAVTIFDGPVLTGEDPEERGEVRELSFGLLGPGVVICVVHTDRYRKTRIVSARKDTGNERRLVDAYLTKAAR